MAVPTGDQVRAHLDRILGSPEFVRSARLSALLRLLVERSLEGRAEELKEIAIAGELHGNSGYDPAVDSSVRVEARRLRTKLEAYYRNGGAAESVRIDIPKGGYAPVFVEAPSASSTPVDQRWFKSHRLAVAAGLLVLVAFAAFAINNWLHDRETNRLLSEAATISPARTDYHLLTQPERDKKHPLDRLMTSAALLERALEINPRRLDVYTALARTYWFAGDYDRALYRRSGQTAGRALALGLESADLHFYRGYAFFFADRQFSAAFDSFRRATELNPSEDRTYRYAMDSAWLSGRISEAAPVLDRARKYHSQSDMLDFAEVGYRIRMRQPTQALVVAEAFVSRRPNQAAAHRVHGGVLAHLGRYEESLRAYREALRRSPGDRLALSALGYVQAKAGDKRGARRTLETLKDAPPLLRVPALLGLDDRAALLEALTVAKTQNDHGFVYLAGDTRFTHLLENPQFAAILPRI